MAAISGQPSPKPSQVTNPVPGEQGKDEVSALLEEFNSASVSMPQPAAQSGQDEVAALMDEFNNAPVQSEQAPVDQFAPEPGRLEANIEQFKNFTTRLQAGLAANDTEKLGFLKNKFGEENAMIKGDKLYFRRSNKEKFKRLDPEVFELVNDIIPDFAREIVTEAAMLPSELAGGAMFAPLGPSGIAAGALSGRVASVPMANEFANRVAQAAGVPQDPNRDIRLENALGSGTEAVAPYVGRKVLSKLKFTSLGQKAYQEAVQAGETKLTALTAQDRAVNDATEALAREGRMLYTDGAIVGMPGTKIKLMGHQIAEGSVVAKEAVDKLTGYQPFLNLQQQQAENVGDMARNVLEEIARRNVKGPYKPEYLSSKITNAVDSLVEEEGKAIGGYKAKAMAQLKNERLPLDQQTSEKLQFLLKEFGFTPKLTKQVLKSKQALASGYGGMQPAIRDLPTKLSYIAPKEEDIGGLVKMGLTSTGEARAVVNALKESAQNLGRGYTIADLEALRNVLGSVGDRLGHVEAGAKVSNIAGDFREAYRKAIEAGLDNEVDRKAFNEAMDNFSNLKNNVTTIKKALNDEYSAKAIVSSFFTGKENLAKIKALKQISPESFSSLKEEWINQQMEKFATKTGTKLDADRFLKDIKVTYGDQFMKEVINDGPGANLDTLKNALTVAQRIDDQFRNIGVDAATQAQKNAAANSLIGLAAKSPARMTAGLAQLFGRTGEKENALMSILREEGIAKYIANYPGKIDKKSTYDKLSQIVAQSKFMQMTEKSMARPAKAITREKARQQAD